MPLPKHRWIVLAIAGFVAASIALALVLVQLTAWYLGHCSSQGECRATSLVLRFWWVAYVPASVLFAAWFHRKLAPAKAVRAADTATISPVFRDGLAVALLLAVSSWTYFSVTNRTQVDGPLRADARVYFTYAYNVVRYRVFSGVRTWESPGHPPAPPPQALVTPGYPLLLATLDPRPEPDFVHRVTAVQAGMGVLSVLLVFAISRRFLGRIASLLAALLAALSPHLLVMSAYVLTETFFTLLLLGSILLSIAAARKPTAAFAVAVGLCWGLCALVRPTAQFIPPLFALAVWLLPRMRPYWRATAFGLLAFALVVLPWQLRKAWIPKDPAAPSLMVNFVNFGGYAGFMYEGRPETLGRPYAFDPDIARTQQSLANTLGAIADRVRREPATYLQWFAWGKPKSFLSWENIDGVGDVFVYPVVRSPFHDDIRFAIIRSAMHWAHWPLMLAGLLGAGLAWLPQSRTGLSDGGAIAARIVSGVFLYALAFHVVGAPLPRYGIPFRLLLLPLAVLSPAMLWALMRSGRQGASPAPAGR